MQFGKKFELIRSDVYLCRLLNNTSTFLGHVMGSGGLEDPEMSGMIKGKRGQGKRRVVWLTSMRELLEERNIHLGGAELLRTTRDRNVGWDMITDVHRGYGT